MKKRNMPVLAGLILLLPVLIASIVLSSESGYNSTDTNVTQESNFSHLNISDPNLVLYLPFDVQERVELNKTYDFTNNSNDGTITNATWTSSGYIGGTYLFDGDDTITISSDTSLENQNFTLCFWARLNNYAATLQGGVGKGASSHTGATTQEFALEFHNNLAYFTMSNGTSITTADTAAIGDANWHHWCGQVNSSSYLLYKDGSPTGAPLSRIIGDISYSNHRNMYVSHSTYPFNGSIDEVMIFNRTLNSTEILAIYNNQSARFFPTGEMLFQDNNFTTNNTVNISLANCSENQNTNLQVKINSGGFVNLSSCAYNNYNIDGNLTNANVTFRFTSDSNSFYSPTLEGNITLTSWLNNAPQVQIISPSGSLTSTSTTLSVITDKYASCNYSLDSWVTNNSMTANSTGTGHTASASLTDGVSYTMLVSCIDLLNRTNSSVTGSFSISVPSTSTTTTTSSGNPTFSPSASQLENSYTNNYRKNTKVVIGGNTLTVTDLQGDTATIEVGGNEYSIDENGEIKIDTDSDGYYDVQVNAGSVNEVYATLTLKTIYEEIPKEEKEGVIGNIVENTGNFLDENKWIWILIGVVGLGILIFAGVKVLGKK